MEVELELELEERANNERTKGGRKNLGLKIFEKGRRLGEKGKGNWKRIRDGWVVFAARILCLCLCRSGGGLDFGWGWGGGRSITYCRLT